MRILGVFMVIAAALVGVCLPAAAQNAANLCEGLGRSNIDCACVSKRIDAYEKRARNGAALKLVREGYKYALGLDNAYPESLEFMDRDPMAALAVIQAFDPVGGLPGNIDDFERGCAIEGAPLPAIPEFPSAPIYAKYHKVCIDWPMAPRYCQCDTARVASATSKAEFTAYYYSFNETVDAGGGDRISLDELAAKKTGVSIEEYRQLQASARAKIKSPDDQPNSCDVILNADKKKGRDAAARAGIPIGFENIVEQEPFDPFAAPQATPDASTKPDMASLPQMPGAMDPSAFSKAMASDLVKKGCKDGEAYCSCVSKTFDEKVLPKASSGAVAVQLATFFVGDGLDPMQMLSIVQGVSDADRNAAMQIFPSVMNSTMACEQ